MDHSSAYTLNEKKSAEAFSKQSLVFDQLYATNKIIEYKRERVRKHVSQYISQGNILELNAGTGEDATYFGKQGFHVHATDVSAGMQQKLIEKTANNNLSHLVTTEIISFTNLAQLVDKGPYDLIFSNFAGLNCTGELDKVLDSFAPLLKQNGIVTLVVMPRFCLWETLLLFKGRFKNAFRRFNSSKGVTANVEGVNFLCWYYSPLYIEKAMEQNFELLSVEGLCSIVPPSYFESFPIKFPWLYKQLVKMENKFKRTWFCRNTGDYFIVSLKKKS